jgi:hypothetical protein
MEELLPVVSDDLDWKESGHKTRTPAEHTRYLGFEGRWYRLDMTSAHTQELEAFLERFIRAGMLTDTPPKPRKSSLGGEILKANERNRKKAAWADAHGYPYTNRKAGGFYFPVKTEQAYQEAQRVLGGDRPE